MAVGTEVSRRTRLLADKSRYTSSDLQPPAIDVAQIVNKTHHNLNEGKSTYQERDNVHHQRHLHVIVGGKNDISVGLDVFRSLHECRLGG